MKFLSFLRSLRRRPHANRASGDSEGRLQIDVSASFPARVFAHCESILVRLRGCDSGIRLHARFGVYCPHSHQAVALRVFDELLTNAIEHGLCSRQAGHINLLLAREANGGLVVRVTDDGCGFSSETQPDGNGFNFLRQLGALRIDRCDQDADRWTSVTVSLPLGSRMPHNLPTARELIDECKDALF